MCILSIFEGVIFPVFLSTLCMKSVCCARCFTESTVIFLDSAIGTTSSTSSIVRRGFRRQLSTCTSPFSIASTHDISIAFSINFRLNANVFFPECISSSNAPNSSSPSNVSITPLNSSYHSPYKPSMRSPAFFADFILILFLYYLIFCFFANTLVALTPAVCSRPLLLEIRFAYPC